MRPHSDDGDYWRDYDIDTRLEEGAPPRPLTLSPEQRVVLRKIAGCSALTMRECIVARGLASIGVIVIDDDHHFGAYLTKLGEVTHKAIGAEG